MNNKFRNKLALILIGSFLLIIAAIIILPYAKGLGDYEGWQDDMISTLDRVMSAFIGLIGIVIGYYFGSNSSNSSDN